MTKRLSTIIFGISFGLAVWTLSGCGSIQEKSSLGYWQRVAEKCLREAGYRGPDKVSGYNRRLYEHCLTRENHPSKRRGKIDPQRDFSHVPISLFSYRSIIFFRR